MSLKGTVNHSDVPAVSATIKDGILLGMLISGRIRTVSLNCTLSLLLKMPHSRCESWLFVLKIKFHGAGESSNLLTFKLYRMCDVWLHMNDLNLAKEARMSQRIFLEL